MSETPAGSPMEAPKKSNTGLIIGIVVVLLYAAAVFQRLEAGISGKTVMNCSEQVICLYPILFDRPF